MHSIPAPVIKTLFDHCDLPTAIVIARVTKRCSSIFRQYREEILIRGEYVNVPNMFKYCSDEFIIHMSKHEFFDKEEARKCCRRMRYELHEKMGYGKLVSHYINNDLLREIFEKNKWRNIIFVEHPKLSAARLGIDINIPYNNDRNGLHAAILLQNKEMINKLQHRGNFYTYCVTGYYHLANNYEVEDAIKCINNSKEPIVAFNYIEKRGYKFRKHEYLALDCCEVLKIALPKITKLPRLYYITTNDYNSLMLLYNKLLEFSTSDEIFRIFAHRNDDFTRYLLQKDKNRANFVTQTSALNLLDLLDNNVVMQNACEYNEYTLIRALVHRNGREWAHQFDHPFIEKYYS